MSLRRCDARFLLPRPPETALVLGALEGWREGLSRIGVELRAAGDDSPPQLAVAPARMASRAIASGARMILLEGATPRRLRQGPLAARRLLARPGVEQPALLLPLDDPVAAGYAVEHWSVVDRRWKAVRALVARELVRRRRFPNVRDLVTVAGSDRGAPFMVVAASARFDLPADVRPLLALGQGDALSRNVFHLFPPGSPLPRWVLKFARMPGYAEPFERDERGLGMATRAGGRVAAHAPTLIGRFEHNGIHASVETAAAGTRLRELLLRPGPREKKLRLVESVASWIIAVGEETAAEPGALEEERRRLSEETVPPWRSKGASGDLVATLPPLAAVLQHNDLGSWNIVVEKSGFKALDWESAREHGLPLWDLFYFLADALAILDGSTGGGERHLHTVRLFRGDLPSSKLLFDWTRRAVAGASVPPDAVGKIATLCWLHHSLSGVGRSVAIASFAAASAQPVHGTERVAAAWLADPALGESWDRWQ